MEQQPFPGEEKKGFRGRGFSQVQVKGTESLGEEEGEGSKSQPISASLQQSKVSPSTLGVYTAAAL